MTRDVFKYFKHVRSLQEVKGTEAGKKSGKIVKAVNKDAEMNNRNDVKNEEVTFSETELKKFEEIAKSWED